MEQVIKYLKDILILIFGIMIFAFLFNINQKSKSSAKEINDKLKSLDKRIYELRNQRSSLDSSIYVYNEKIKTIDSLINNIKIEKKTINNFFEKKASEIEKYDARQTDSLLRKRYRY